MTPASHIRPAAVAGMFYPGDPAVLSDDIAAMLNEAAPSTLRPKALIVPHAGYIYSGPVAATAYALLRPLRGAIRRVVLFGPAHRVAVRGLALPRAEAFITPLGSIPIDAAGVRLALALPHVLQTDAPHAQEHSLEVQLPFLQSVLGDDFNLVPFVVGDATAEEVAAVIDALWGGDDNLIVISSDLSHYHPYGEAQRLDQASVDRILDLTLLADHEQACGATPINGLIEVARRRKLAVHLLDLRNSGDTAGDRSRVVGYAAIAFTAAKAGDVR